MTDETRKAFATMFNVESVEKINQLKKLVYILAVMLSVSMAINAVLIVGQQRNGGATCSITEETRGINSPVLYRQNSTASLRQAGLVMTKRKLSA